MNFIDKLISDTLNGDWNYSWIWSNDKYTFKVAKHPMSGLNFQIEYGGKKGALSEKQLLIFPNGYGVEYPSDIILKLKEAIDLSLENTVVDTQKNYINPPVVEDEETIEPKATMDEEKSVVK